MKYTTAPFWVVCCNYAHDYRTAQQARAAIDRLAAAVADGTPGICANPHAIVQSWRDPRESK